MVLLLISLLSVLKQCPLPLLLVLLQLTVLIKLYAVLWHKYEKAID